MTEATPEQIVAFLTGAQAVTDIIERLHTIRDHLRTGRFGQREVWEEWLTEAAAEIEHLRRRLNEVDAQLTAEDGIHARECMALRAEKDAEIERLREHVAALQLVATAHDAEIGRLRVALQTVREENDRAKRQFTNVSNKILDDACRALEPKP